MSKLPKGWQNATLGELGHWCGGGTPSKDRPAFWANGTIPWVSPKDMKREQIDSAEDYITQAAVDGSATQIVGKGAVLVVTRSGILRHSLPVAITTCEAAINQDLKALSPVEGIDPFFISRQMQALSRSILSQCAKSGTTVDSVDYDRLKAFPIKIAPTAEQRRIITKLDSLFARTKAARDELDRIPLLVEHYKQAILEKAFEGAFAGKDLGEHVPLRHYTSSLDQGWSPKCEAFASDDPDSWAVIKTTAIQPLRFLKSENKVLPSGLPPRPHIQIQEHDILVTRAGPRTRVGISCLVTESRPRLMLCDKAYRLRAKKGKADPAFLAMMLNAPQALSQIEEMKTGISDSGLNLRQDKLLDLTVPLLNLEQQRSTVRLVKEAMLWLDTVSSEQGKAASLLEQLDQSILTKAFRGDLIAQDQNDEPAEQLLRRIRSELRAKPRGGGKLWP